MPTDSLSRSCWTRHALLTGTDGERKMSKSLGNYIGVTDPPDEMYGKTLSIPGASSMEMWWSLLLLRRRVRARRTSAPRDAKRGAGPRTGGAFPLGAEAARRRRRRPSITRVHVQHAIPRMPDVQFTCGGWRANTFPH